MQINKAFAGYDLFCHVIALVSVHIYDAGAEGEMGKNVEKQVEGKDPACDKLVGDIATALRGVQELCRQHGIFDGLREFLQCQKCGLKESVAFDGRLLTYCDIDNPVDTGLRFPEPDDDGYSRCPECGEVVRVEEGEDELPCA